MASVDCSYSIKGSGPAVFLSTVLVLVKLLGMEFANTWRKILLVSVMI